jgi:hypothetical protein
MMLNLWSHINNFNKHNKAIDYHHFKYELRIVPRESNLKVFYN